jgi:hypothetical protein
VPPLSPLSLSLMWLPEGLHRSEVISTCTPSCCGNPGSDPKPIYFRNLDWIGETGRSHRSPYMYVYSKVLHLWCRVVAPVSSHRCRGVEIFTTLRSAMSASSSTHVREGNPHNRSTRIHH